MDQKRAFGNWRWNLVGILGFLTLTGGLLVAHWNPATGYELSIYTATPIGFWIGIVIAFFCSLLLGFWRGREEYRLLGVVLGGLASTAVLALPLIRNYRSHGTSDALTHVGFARELVAGSMTPVDLFYPGIHTLATFIDLVIGFAIWRSMLFVPLLVVVAYFIFVPLVAREIVGGSWATTVGAFSSFLLVPLHQIANTTHAHPSSQAILFTPVVIFLILRYIRSRKDNRWDAILSPTGAALYLGVLAIILYHPQQALNVILLLSAISLLQLVLTRVLASPRPAHAPVYSITTFSVIAYTAWLFRYPFATGTAVDALESISTYLFGTPPTAGTAVGSQVGSLQAIGVSLPIFYLKLFGVSTVFVVLTAGVVLAAHRSRFSSMSAKHDTNTVIRYFEFALFLMLLVTLLYFFGDVSEYYFREAGFMLMIGTILGAAGIAYAAGLTTTPRSRATARVTMSVGFAVLLLLSMPVLFNSPYIHRANAHVTDAKVSGYETTFQVTDESSWMAGVRQEPQRYYDALVSISDNGRRDGTVNSSEIHRLQDQRSGAWYLVMHRNTFDREVIAYRGYRYTERDLRAVDRQTRVNRVLSNGHVDLFYIP